VVNTAPPITVVVCTRDQPAALARCVDSVLATRYPRKRILIVDNAPTSDATRNVARDKGVEYLCEPRPGLSNARNAALREVPDEIIAWLDDDEIADEHWLAEIARGFAEHPEADVVTGVVVPAELETAAQVWFEDFGGHSKGRGFTPAVFSPATAKQQSPLYPLPPFGAGANMAWRPGVAQRIGGFDRALGAGTPAMGGEDTVAFAKVLRRGGTIVYQPTALTRHVHRKTLAELRRQLYGYGVGLTAGYTSLLLANPLVLAPLLALLPHALRDLRSPDGPRLATVGADFPADLLAQNRRGLLRGPAAYLKGRLGR
jgi:GT2 family glycosyltransferase